MDKTSQQTLPTAVFHDANKKPIELVLYKKDSCPFCQKVMTSAKSMHLELPMRDISQEAAAKEHLVQVGGKAQVPCLFIDGKPLYESAAIVDFLRGVVQASTSSMK